MLVPGVERDDHLDPLLLTDRANAEKRRHIDDAHAPNLHVVLLEFVPASDQHVVPLFGGEHQVVRHEAVSAFHQIQHALALSYTARAHEEQPDPVHVGQRAVQRRGWRHREFEERLDAPVELLRRRRATQDRDSSVGGLLEEERLDVQPLGDEYGWHVESEEHGESAASVGFG